MCLDSFVHTSHLSLACESHVGLGGVTSRATTFYELLLAVDQLIG